MAGADTRLHAHASRMASRLTQGTSALSICMLGGEPKVVCGSCLGRERADHAQVVCVCVSIQCRYRVTGH